MHINPPFERATINVHCVTDDKAVISVTRVEMGV